MEVTMNELNYWFHNDRAKRESYIVLKSIELKFTSEMETATSALNSNSFPTHICQKFLTFSILRCVLLGFNLSEKTAMNSNNFYKTSRNTPI